MKKIMIVNTNVANYPGTDKKTGLWIGELVHFYDVFKHSNIELHIYSISGGKVPIDPLSTHPLTLDLLTKTYMEDHTFMSKLEDTKAFTEANIDDYDGVYFTGGHGVMFDFPDNVALKTLISHMHQQNKVIASVCHGTAALLNVYNNDRNLLEDKRITGFSNAEEYLAMKTNIVPFMLETELKKAGAVYVKGLVPFTPKVVIDGNFITGQNPQSPKAVGKAVLNYMEG